MVLGLILVATLARCLFALALGLGVDESYMVGAGRRFDWSYFDHPPIAWWLARGAAWLMGDESPLVVRAPFILLFALTTWAMYRLTARLYSPRAGLWAALALSLSPVFGVTTASWVLPDGPLDLALLAFVWSFHSAFDARDRRSALGWWIAAGLAAGLAMLSKYSAGLVLLGAPLFLLTQPRHRVWLARPEPWLAGALGFLLFCPVILWNADHGWASFAFQGGRAGGAAGFHPLAPLSTLAGEALFLLPWIWIGLIAALVGALRRGPSEPRGWLLACLSLGPILLFAIVSAWARNRVLFHWAAPGYLMLFPLMGVWLAGLKPVWPRRVAIATAAVTGLLALGVGTQVRWNWWPAIAGDFAPGTDPAKEALDWTELTPLLAARGLDGPAAPVIAATRWLDAGKLGYALGATRPVICLGDDPRQFGVIAPVSRFEGRDALILSPRATLQSVRDGFGRWFETVEELAPFEITHAGRPAFTIQAFLGHGLRGTK